ncbi:MAG: hypothetical protein DMF49_05215 [Acidobacteria bacterium]|nr:MAG: hypothetical protein DMF49_05215 [Acidobacteriota bacterium]
MSGQRNPLRRGCNAFHEGMTAARISRAVSLSSLLLTAVALPSDLPAQVPCGSTLSQDTTLREDLSCPGDGLRLGSNGITLDCAGHAIRGEGGYLTMGVSATGVEHVVVRNCHIMGFGVALRLQDSPASVVEGNKLSGDPSYALYALRSPGLSVQDNMFTGPGANVLIVFSSGIQILENQFDPASPDPGEWINVGTYGCPLSRFSRNHSSGSVYVALTHQSDGSRAEDNHLLGGSLIAIGNSTDCVITRNQLGPVDPGFLYANTALHLYGGRHNEISHNVVEGHRLGGVVVNLGSEANKILENSIHAASYGISVYSGHGNSILENEIKGSSVGIEVVGIQAGAYPAENIFTSNRLSGAVLGILEVQLESAGGNLPNSYVDNVIEGSKVFGLLAWGSSPRLFANRFIANGTDPYTPTPDEESLFHLLGGLRGGVAFFPYVGNPASASDDGNPSTDVLAIPIIGSPDQPNWFSGNGDVDIYALDGRAENWRTLDDDNLFEFRSPSTGAEAQRRDHERIRQDWFGLLRVEDTFGHAVVGVTVEVRDARGHPAGLFASGSSGYAPAESDPDRTQGLAEGEPGGPLSPWPRFTEYVVASNGQREDLTPHRLSVRSPSGMAKSRYSWDGVDNDPLAFRIVGDRYQTALVVLDKRLAP